MSNKDEQAVQFKPMFEEILVNAQAFLSNDVSKTTITGILEKLDQRENQTHAFFSDILTDLATICEDEGHTFELKPEGPGIHENTSFNAMSTTEVVKVTGNKALVTATLLVPKADGERHSVSWEVELAPEDMQKFTDFGKFYSIEKLCYTLNDKSTVEVLLDMMDQYKG